MTFSEALDIMKRGGYVFRDGWNGAGQHVYLQDDLVDLSVFHDLDLHAVNHQQSEDTKFMPCFVLFTTGKKFQPGWIPSTSDLLAEDWQQVMGL